MALTKCRECGSSVSTSAKSCPSCGIRKPGKKPGGFATAIALIIILLMIIGSFGKKDRVSNNYTNKDQSNLAYHMCQGYVKVALKSPSTAEFPPFQSYNAQYDGYNKYLVSGYVDAQNSFGAMLRTSYTCNIEQDKSTGSWHLIDLKVDKN